MKTYKVDDIANKILAKATSNDCEDLITNLKLQKLLYYMQGFHLAFFNAPLFNEEIEAWTYGPVVPESYYKYKKYGKVGIRYGGDIICLKEEKEEILFDEVYNVYGKFSAIGLMNLTHKETPWKSVEPAEGNIISKDSLKAFFKTRLKK